MKSSLIRISKFLSLVLRHKPEKIQLSLDSGGWAKVDELLFKANRAGVKLDRSTLRQVVVQNNKQRFSFNESGTKIRANQGHSIRVDLKLTPIAPPEKLYHGTAARFLTSIKARGLQPQGRQHVHLSEDEKTALAVGWRHGKPVILVIQASRMAEAGYKFYRSKNGVWLTDHVPVAYIIV